MSKKFLIVALIAYFVAVFITYISGDFESLAVQIWNLLPPLLAAILGVYTVSIYSINNPHAKAIAFMALGVFFWFLGDFIWFIYEYFLNKNPFPSIADYFYLIAYPFLLLGLIQELRSNVLKWTYCKIIASVSLSLFFGLIVLYFGILKAYNPFESILNNVVAMAYGVGDLILIIFAVAILMIAIGYQKGKLFLPWLLILIGFVFILAADILFAIYRNSYEEYLGYYRMLDLGWISGFLFVSFGFYSIGDAIKETRIKLIGKV